MTHELTAPYDYNSVLKITPQEPDFPRKRDTWRFIETVVFLAPDPRYKPNDTYPGRKYTNAVEARTYARGESVICLFWARSRDGSIHTRGKGSASGYGYHKSSAAIDEAVYNAGIVMEQHFNGYGEQPTEHAIRAIAKRLGWNTGDVMTFGG